MTGYQTWYEIKSLSLLNAHIQYLLDTMLNGSCLMLSFLDPPVEVPIYKREFKTKATVVAPLIRTSSVGRAELGRIRDKLRSAGYALKERRSPKRKYLNQISVQLATNDSRFPLHVRKILEAIAAERREQMPEAMIVGYFAADFSPNLPGQWHRGGALHETIFNIGKKVGGTFR